MLKLYDYKAAPSPRRARIFLAEKAVKYENIQVDIRTGEQLKPAFKAINPRCTVPALVTETGDTICENVAIASYIEDLYPAPPLMGITPIERAHILEWNWRSEMEGLAAVAEILRNTSPGMKDRAITGPRNFPQIPELAERGRQRLQYFFEDLNTQLAASPFVAGGAYSLADITALVCVDFAAWVKASPAEDLTALQAWHKSASSRPASQA